MFITYNLEGKVVAYSDGQRNPSDFKEGEVETEVAFEFAHVDCVEGGLTFEDGKLLNSGEIIAEEIVKEPNQPE